MMKLRPFQVHLSTALTLVFVASVLVWANVREIEGDLSGPEVDYKDKFDIYIVSRYGWPVTAVRRVLLIISGRRPSEWILSGPQSRISAGGIGINAAVFLLIMFGVWFCIEFWIRKAANRQLADSNGLAKPERH